LKLKIINIINYAINATVNNDSLVLNLYSQAHITANVTDRRADMMAFSSNAQGLNHGWKVEGE